MAIKQRGAALVIVLFIVALAATIAADMAVNLMVQVQKTTNIQQHQQSKWYAYATEELAKKVLVEVKKQDKEQVNLSQVWATENEPYPVDGGYLKVKLTDLRACLNLNALAQPPAAQDNKSSEGQNPAHRALLHLLQNIEELNNEESEEALADSVYDWLDEDNITYRSGAEEDDYMANRTPYMTANNLFAAVSELRVVKGFNPLVMEKLLPYVCVIPGNTELILNVNTLQPEQAMLITALAPGVSQAGAEAALAARPEKGFEKVSDFIEELKKQGAKDVQTLDKVFTVNSNYFQLVAVAFFNERRFTMTSTLAVKDGQVTVLARKFGGVQ
ncbi:type II secretion system minor pseudopilin GspK [Pseudoalteromonas fenneropenaei]|uniref:Type II secretion system protein K n=1 Tax=Pseudoalteromonas fenneropenaei TaxID=1737459 RepID=A0ABV7CQ66_9GAMM